jgi:hypothetical protein
MPRTQGLYKQIELGDCKTSQPWGIQFAARAKWDAHNKNKGLSKHQAMELCVRAPVHAPELCPSLRSYVAKILELMSKTDLTT